MKIFLYFNIIVLLFIITLNIHCNDKKRNFYIGIAPIPRNFPGKQSDWLNLLENIKYSGEIITVQNNWRESINKTGIIPEYISLFANQQKNYSYKILFGINFFNQSGNYEPDLKTKTNNINNWTNNEAKEYYRQLIIDIINKYKPEYFALGIEVNLYYSKHKGDFIRFVEFYKILYDEIKKIDNKIKIFVTFQLEMMKGLGEKSWGEKIRPQWSILKLFKDKLDLIVFTSYPEIAYSSPSNIPENYYEEIKKYTDKKIAFSEIGWSSNNKNESDQCEYIEKIKSMTKQINIEFVNWIFMHDLPNNKPLTKTGLKYSNGSPKKAWYKWCDFKNN